MTNGEEKEKKKAHLLRRCVASLSRRAFVSTNNRVPYRYVTSVDAHYHLRMTDRQTDETDVWRACRLKGRHFFNKIKMAPMNVLTRGCGLSL
jgi:hypothetical protein